MSMGASVTALLTATVAQVSRSGAEPEEAHERRHHLKDGKGFVNPWDSWQDMQVFKILVSLIR